MVDKILSDSSQPDIQDAQNESQKEIIKEKSRRRETKNLSTDADRRTNIILGRLRDLSF